MSLNSCFTLRRPKLGTIHDVPVDMSHTKTKLKKIISELQFISQIHIQPVVLTLHQNTGSQYGKAVSQNKILKSTSFICNLLYPLPN